MARKKVWRDLLSLLEKETRAQKLEKNSKRGLLSLLEKAIL